MLLFDDISMCFPVSCMLRDIFGKDKKNMPISRYVASKKYRYSAAYLHVLRFFCLACHHLRRNCWHVPSCMLIASLPACSSPRFPHAPRLAHSFVRRVELLTCGNAGCSLASVFPSAQQRYDIRLQPIMRFDALCAF